MPDNASAYESITALAYADPAFRQELTTNPQATLQKFGINAPADVKVTVLDFDPKHLYIFVPPAFKPLRVVGPGANRGDLQKLQNLKTHRPNAYKDILPVAYEKISPKVRPVR